LREIHENLDSYHSFSSVGAVKQVKQVKQVKRNHHATRSGDIYIIHHDGPVVADSGASCFPRKWLSSAK
ncbi:MAG: hypothetical protein KAJ95_00730, partial [Gammaproteobacteria bacterium]|nr:hypothetical protein [Gammaproteobacteria bacterium]